MNKLPSKKRSKGSAGDVAIDGPDNLAEIVNETCAVFRKQISTLTPEDAGIDSVNALLVVLTAFPQIVRPEVRGSVEDLINCAVDRLPRFVRKRLEEAKALHQLRAHDHNRISGRLYAAAWRSAHTEEKVRTLIKQKPTISNKAIAISADISEGRVSQIRKQLSI